MFQAMKWVGVLAVCGAFVWMVVAAVAGAK